jgi:anti-sigma B factor antagonist
MSVASSEKPRCRPPYKPFATSVVRNRDDVAVVAVGELDIASIDRLGEEVRDAWAAGPARIVLDLCQVDFIDSAGLRMLLSLRDDAKRNRHALTLVPPTPAARRIFEITGTRGLFDWRFDRAKS